MAISLLTLSATSAAGAEGEPTIVLDFNDASSPVVFDTLSRLLDDAPVIGTPPDCRMTIQSAPMPIDELMAELNRAFGIAFVETTEGFQIFVPEDTERLCTSTLSGG